MKPKMNSYTWPKRNREFWCEGPDTLEPKPHIIQDHPHKATDQPSKSSDFGERGRILVPFEIETLSVSH
jgi:hypothetical protein